MLYILDEHGEEVSRSRNLAGIRREVGRQQVRLVSIKRLPRAEGELYIEFEKGWTFKTGFACFEVLKDAVRNWRNLYGAALIVDGRHKGKVEYRNPALLSGRSGVPFLF